MNGEAPASPKYIPRIDVLRSIAVLGVLLFHLGIFENSGFLGVDSFFTISGYLICAQILAWSAEGNFSFATFYSRRIKRLFPSLAVCLLFSFALALYCLSDAEFRTFLKSLQWTVFSVSNLYFKDNLDYFNLANGASPLLHTWSLSVEEQFYLFFPVVLICAIKVFGKIAKSVAMISTFLVFALCLAVAARVVAVKNHEMSLFYLAGFRSFQFMIGACIAMAAPRPRRSSTLVYGFFVVALLAVLCVPRQTSAVCVLVLQAAASSLTGILLVLSGASTGRWDGYKSKIERIFVGIGKRSYSIYLFHWPIIVFCRKYFGGLALNAQEIVLCLGATALITEINYVLVEKKLRYAKLPPAETLCLTATSLLAIFCFGRFLENRGAEFHRFNNYLGLRPISEVKFDTWKEMESLSRQEAGEKRSLDSKRKVLFIGDSQAADLLNLAVEKTRQQPLLGRRYSLHSFVMPVYCGTLYFPNESSIDRYLSVDRRILYEEGRGSLRKTCIDKFDELKNADLGSYDEIVVSNLWFDYQLDYLDYSFEFLKEHSKKQVKIFIVGNKDLKVGLPELIDRCEGLFFQTKKCSSPEVNRLFSVNRASVELNRGIRQIAENHGFVFIDPYDVICPLGGCTAVIGDSPVFFDNSHFSRSGIEKYSNSLLASFL